MSATEILEQHSTSAPLIKICSSLRTENWYAFHLRHQHEPVVENLLSAKGIEFLSPKREIVRHWSDRKKIIQEPLFRGYIFARMSVDRIPVVLASRGVVAAVGNAAGTYNWIPDQEIEALKTFVREQIRLDPFPYLKEGMRVRIRRGPLKHIEGFVVKKRGQCRIVISIELMQQSVAVEIDEALLEKC